MAADSSTVIQQAGLAEVGPAEVGQADEDSVHIKRYEYYSCCDKNWEHSHMCPNSPIYKSCCKATWCNPIYCPRNRIKMLKKALIDAGVSANDITWTVSHQTGFYVKRLNMQEWVCIQYPEYLHGNYRRTGFEKQDESVDIMYGVWDDFNEVFTQKYPTISLPIGKEIDSKIPEEKELNMRLSQLITHIVKAEEPITEDYADVHMLKDMFKQLCEKYKNPVSADAQVHAQASAQDDDNEDDCDDDDYDDDE